MIGRCHCGQVQWTTTGPPERLVTCNCSICRKLGALWAHMPVDQVTITGETLSYIRSDCDGDISFHTCPTCGATTHWFPMQKDGDLLAVNARLADPEALKGIPLRRFDGAETWTFLD